jgi:hypothetical protein
MLLVSTVIVVNFIDAKKFNIGVLKLCKPAPFSTQQMLEAEVC